MYLKFLKKDISRIIRQGIGFILFDDLKLVDEVVVIGSEINADKANKTIFREIHEMLLPISFLYYIQC